MMKLNEILKCEEIQIEILDIVNVDFTENMDVPRFLDIQKINDWNKNNMFSETIFTNIANLMSAKHMTEDQKIKEISTEGEFSKKLGLGFSKGKTHSHPSGVDRKITLKMIKLIIWIIDDDDKYKNIGLMKYALKNLGRDGFSDIFSNMGEEIIKKENNILITKLKQKIKDPNSAYKNDSSLIFGNDIDNTFYLSFNGVKRYLTNLKWTISGYYEGEEEKEIRKIISLYNKEKKEKFIDNEQLRNSFQFSATYSIKNSLDLKNSWKKFVDHFENIRNLVNVNDIKNIDMKVTIKTSEDLGRKICINSQKTPKNEKVYSNLIKTALNVQGITFNAEDEVSTDFTSGNIDIYINKWNELIELKLYKNNLDSSLHQLYQYSSSQKYCEANLTLFLIMSRNKKDIVIEQFNQIKSKYKKMKLILFFHNFKTASKFSNKDIEGKSKEEIKEMSLNNKVMVIK